MACSDCPNQPADPEGRALHGNGRGLHTRTHPTPVEGCFGCKALGLSWSIKAGNSARGDGISISSALKEEARERAKAEPDRYAPAGSRWI